MINPKQGPPPMGWFTVPRFISALIVPAGMLFPLSCSRDQANRTSVVPIAPAAQPAGGVPGGMPMGAPLGGPTGMPQGGMPDGDLPEPLGDVKEPCAPATTNFVHLRGRGGADGLTKFQAKAE